jgi:hypothetical protein
MRKPMKTLPLFAAALMLLFSGLLQAQTQVDLTKQVKGVLPAPNGDLPAGIATGSGMVSSGVGQPGVYQTKPVGDMRALAVLFLADVIGPEAPE